MATCMADPAGYAAARVYTIALQLPHLDTRAALR